MEIVEIIFRILCAICALGCILGLIFWDNKVFKYIGLYAGTIAFGFGVIDMILFAVFGKL